MNRQHTSLEEQKVDKKLFGTRINKARKDRGLTAEKLAEACNINSTYLRQIEGGKKLPSLPVFATLCRELRVSPNYILPDLVEGTEAEKIQKIFSESDPTPSQIEMLAEMAGVILKEIGKVYERKNEYSPASSDAGLFRVFAVIRAVKCYYRAPILL